jgi:hypothetical protein
MKDKLQALYLEWVNQWLTVPAIADYYGVTVERMERLINVGRRVHESRVTVYKLKKAIDPAGAVD